MVNKRKLKPKETTGVLGTVKGFRDIEASKRIAIRNIIENTFQLYNFQPVETPIIEYEKFVKSNNENDEAVGDIFKLQDKGKRKLALRYEFTFQLKRLAKNKKLPYRRYQIGPVFRDEPVKSGRFRQFIQCDADIVGSTIKDEAEILKIVSKIFNKLRITFTINVNNRKLLNEILEELRIKEKDKIKIIKEIDKLDKLPESEIKKNLKKYSTGLKKYNADKILSIFKKPEKYFKKYKAYSEIKKLREYCNIYNVKFNFSPFVARGLSYYNGTVFEIKAYVEKLKRIGISAAGGSYMVNGVQSTGISFGLDRLALLTKIDPTKKQILIISLNQDKKAISLAEKIRNLSIPCQIYYGKPGKALEYANSLKIPYVIFLGEQEVKKGKIKLRNMKTGKEKMVSEKELKII